MINMDTTLTSFKPFTSNALVGQLGEQVPQRLAQLNDRSSFGAPLQPCHCKGQRLTALGTLCNRPLDAGDVLPFPFPCCASGPGAEELGLPGRRDARHQLHARHHAWHVLWHLNDQLVTRHDRRSHLLGPRDGPGHRGPLDELSDRRLYLLHGILGRAFLLLNIARPVARGYPDGSEDARDGESDECPGPRREEDIFGRCPPQRRFSHGRRIGRKGRERGQGRERG